MTVVRKICLIFLLWILVMCGFIVFLLGTNIGAYITFTGVKYYIPGLTFDTVSGSWGDFNVTHVVYQTSMGIININRCNILFNIKSIWNRQLHIDRLFLQDVILKIEQDDTTNKADKEYKTIKTDNVSSIPFPIILDNIVLYNTSIISKTVMVELKKIDASLTFRDNLLTILPVHIQGAVLNIFNANILCVQNNIRDMYKYSNQWNLKYVIKLLSNKLLITLPTCDFPSNIIFKDIKGKNLNIIDNYHNYYTIKNFCLQACLYRSVANLKLNIESPHGYCDVMGNIVLKEYYPMNITIAYIAYDSSANRNFNSMRKKNVNNIRLIITGELCNEICLRCDWAGVISTARIELKINLTQLGIPITMSIVGSKIPFSFLGKSDFLIENINIYFIGNVQNYCIQLTSQLSSVKFSSARIVMHAKGDMNSCVISKLKMTVLGGYLDMQGIINWGNIISWNNVFVLNKVSIFQKWLKYPMELSGNITTQGYLSPNSWEMTVSHLDINGNIKNKSISCTGILHSNSTGKWRIPSLSIKCGSNILEIQGELTDHCMVNIVLKAPNCNVIVPGLSGSIYGKFQLYGPVKHPRLLFNVDVCSLHWYEKNISFKKIIINSDIYCNDFVNSKFFLQAYDIKYGNVSLDQVIAKGEGSIKQHYFNLIAYGDMLSGQVKLSGNVDLLHKIWHGKIDKTSIVTPIGEWRLMQDIVFTYQHLIKKIIIDSHYWDVFNCTVFIPNVLKTNVLHKLEAVFKNFNTITPLKISLPDFISMRTVRLHCVNFCWILGTPLPKGVFFFSGAQLNIQSAFAKLRTDPIKINNIRIDIILNSTALYCTWFLNIGNDDQSNGLLRVTTSYHDISKITGNIQVKGIASEFLWDSFILSKESMKGLLNMNIYFHKYANNLKIYGSVQLQDLNFNEPNMPFFIKNSQLFIRFLGDRAVLNGTMDTDAGCKLYVSGNVINFNSIRSTRAFFKIQGNQVNVCISPEIKVKMFLNITCLFSSEKICIQGNVEIPWARIKINESSKNVVRVSSEEIVLDDNLKPMLGNSRNLDILITCNITVCFGDDVNLDGLGLHAKLRGNLEIGYNKNSLILTGNIDMPAGYFQVYGHNLIIKKGQLLFSGTIDQPYLDIEAIFGQSSIKNEIIVGLRITGIFDQLKLEIFSNASSFSSQEIMHDLLGNKNLIITHTDTNIITSLLIGASVKNSEKFINKMGQILGVRDLELNTKDITTTTPLVALSGYIAPGLQIEYGINIFDLSTTIIARYRLHPLLYLEVISGSNQAIDILYKFDF